MAFLFFCLMPTVLLCKETSSTVEKRILQSQMFMNVGDFAEARFALEQALKEMPKEPKLYFHLGVVHTSMGLLNEAAEAYEAAVRIHPGYLGALSELARAYHSLERWDDAIIVYEKIAEIDPSSARPYFEKAMIYRRLGLQEEEKKALAEAYRLNPQFVIQSARLHDFEIDELLAEKEIPLQSSISKVESSKNLATGAPSHPVQDEMQNVPSQRENEKFSWLVMLLLFTTFILIWGGKKFLQLNQ